MKLNIYFFPTKSIKDKLNKPGGSRIFTKDIKDKTEAKRTMLEVKDIQRKGL